MKLVWTKRSKMRFRAASRYLAESFYPEYAENWEDDVFATIAALPDYPEMGQEAFPELHRPELRSLLMKHYDYRIYYRTVGDVIAILSIRHCLMNTDSPLKL